MALTRRAPLTIDVIEGDAPRGRRAATVLAALALLLGGLLPVTVAHAGSAAAQTANDTISGRVNIPAGLETYGERVVELLGGGRFVIDSSRNGNGSNGEWCNPRGRALGERPRLVADSTHLDALLWVKPPGESDGTCEGGPAAGQWFRDIALELARNARW